MSEEQQPQFMIQRVYIKDQSFESPSAPKVFQQEWKPDLNLDLNTEHTELEKDVYEVILTVTATVKNDDQTAFLAEVKQAGVFSISGSPKDQLGHILGAFCPNILYPYAREAISSAVMKGSFPQLALAPINFDALYMQQLEEQKKQAETH